jgi:hypothetical protein
MPACRHAQKEEEKNHKEDTCSRHGLWLGVPAPVAALLGPSTTEMSRHFLVLLIFGAAPLITGVLRERCPRSCILALWLV